MAGTDTSSKLQELHRGFRRDLVDYETLTAQVKGWADAFPEVVRLESLATTDEGRDVWLLTLGPEPDRARPAAWVDGNLHATELCGSSVALGIAEDVIRLHVEPEHAGTRRQLPHRLRREAHRHRLKAGIA